MVERSPRLALRAARRIVLKIGSKSLASEPGIASRLAAELAALQSTKRSFVLVSSGAIALGVAKLGYRTRPKEMARLQAAAAAGQSVLLRRYEEAFEAVGIPVAQVLLTHADLADRTRGNNARAALAALLEAGALPIINENDTVAVDEIRFGDNDQLASMVVPLVDADVLVLLSDVPGLLDHGRRVPLVTDIVQQARPLAGTSTSGVGTGGMASKVEAARKATFAGAYVAIADARTPGVVGALLRGDDVGTLFLPEKRRLSARKHWIAFTLRPQGALVLDAGAAAALLENGSSLLAVGVLGIRGNFNAGDAVTLHDAQGHQLGQGLARISASQMLHAVGRATEKSTHRLVVVHRDEMVTLPCG